MLAVTSCSISACQGRLCTSHHQTQPSYGMPAGTQKLGNCSAANKAMESPSSAERTPQTEHRLSYEAFVSPLQDTSNLPVSQTKRAQSAGTHKSHARRQGIHSRSSSDCFSMDPAQLEADIAALTDAIAVESAGLLQEHAHSHSSNIINQNGCLSAQRGDQDAQLYSNTFPVAAEAYLPGSQMGKEHQQPGFQDLQQPSSDAVHASSQAGQSASAAWAPGMQQAPVDRSSRRYDVSAQHSNSRSVTA